MRCAVAKGLFEPIADLPPLVDRQPFVRDGRSGDIAAEFFQLIALFGLTAGRCVERKARLLGEQGGSEGFRLCRNGAQGQRLTTGVGTDGDSVTYGGADQLVECLTGLEIEVVALGIAHEQPLSFEQPGDACADGV